MHIFHRNNLDVVNISIDRYQEIYPTMKSIDSNNQFMSITLFSGSLLNAAFCRSAITSNAKPNNQIPQPR
jgi:hypothetical protein